MQSGGIETIRVALPSMQSLFLELRFNGQTLSTATGFIVEKESKPLLVTNRHVVTGRHNTTGKPLSTTCGLPNEVAILHNRKGRIGEWVWRLEALLDGDAPRWTEHPMLAGKMDCIVLPLVNFEDVEFYPYSLEEPTHKLKLGPAETISVVGFPFENQWCQTPFPVRDHVLRAKSQQTLGCLVPQDHVAVFIHQHGAIGSALQDVRDLLHATIQPLVLSSERYTLSLVPASV